MNIVVCVLKSGVFKPWTHKDYTVQYGPQHVQWLRDQFATNVSAPHRFVCLSDMDVPGVETIPLEHNLPGWWSKLEVFGAFRRAAYVDLDTVLIGDVGRYLFDEHKFTMAASLTRKYGYNSSIMSWDGDYAKILTTFLDKRDEFMAAYKTHHMWGDQDFIRDMMRGIGPILTFQSRFSGSILSYKRDMRDKDVQRGSARRLRVRLREDWKSKPRFVCFHGNPKPWRAGLDWVPPLCAA